MKYSVDDLRDYERSDTDAMLDWAADEIERLRAIVEGAKLARRTWIVEWGWSGKENGYGYYYRLRDSTTSELAGTSIEDAWAAIYRKDMAFRSNAMEVGE